MTIKYIDTMTYADIPVDRVLESAVGKLKTVLVIGYTEDDGVYIASSTGDKPTLYYLTAEAQKAIMED